MSGRNNPRFGQVAIVGRPNVGKSTLLNALVGEKLSITTAKPHTTRHSILGVLNAAQSQAVFVDTPGHERRSGRALHRLMGRVIHQALESCDLALLVVEATGLRDADKQLIEMMSDRLRKTIVVVNKLDRLERREAVLPLLEQLQEFPFAAYVPISARKGINLEALISAILAALPEGPPMFPPEFTTDRDMKFRAAEVIREKLMQRTHQEVPYGLTVEIEYIGQREDGQWLIHGLIWLERDSHKAIVIGKQGEQLKRVGIAARKEIEAMLGGKVRLELWAKVREHWSDNDNELRRLGFDGI